MEVAVLTCPECAAPVDPDVGDIGCPCGWAPAVEERSARRRRRTFNPGRMMARAGRLAMVYDWRRHGEAESRWRLPSHLRAFLGRLLGVAPDVRDRILDTVEQRHRAALADGSFREARAARQSDLGRRSGAARRAAVSARDAEIVRRLNAGASIRRLAAELGLARSTVAAARDRLARPAPAAAPRTNRTSAPRTNRTSAPRTNRTSADTCELCDGAGTIRDSSGRAFLCRCQTLSTNVR